MNEDCGNVVLLRKCRKYDKLELFKERRKSI